MPDLGKSLPAFCTAAHWKSDRAFQNLWRLDKSRLEIMEKVAGPLNADAQDPVIRIEGQAGAGKTRLAPECGFVADSPSAHTPLPQPTHFSSQGARKRGFSTKCKDFGSQTKAIVRFVLFPLLLQESNKIV